MLRAFAFALGVALSASVLAWDDTAPPGGQAIPALKARVTDTTGTLSATQRSDLEGRLAGWESKTGIQLALLFVATTQPESIEQYAIRVAEAWKLGKKGQDNGALLLIAKNDKKMRLEVGYGLEGNLPDVTARRLLNDTLGPQFRSGRYYEGLTEGIDKIYRVAAGDEKLAPAPVTAAKPAPAARSFRWMDYAVEILVALIVVGVVLRAMLGRVLGAGAGGTIAAAAGWFLTGSVLIAGIAAVLVLAILLSSLGRRGSGGGDGWIGGWGGGHGGSSGGGSDSWSGGGGSFGGGGASASWGDSDGGGGGDSGGGDGGGGGD